MAQQASATPSTDIYSDDMRDDIELPHKTYNFGKTSARKDTICYDNDHARVCQQNYDDCIGQFFGGRGSSRGGGRLNKMQNCLKELKQCMQGVYKPCEEIRHPTTDGPEDDSDDGDGAIPRNQ
jgi:hypothetical protein